jgi:type IV secretory pathway TraG/TraD family ATPase VirD4
MLGSVRRAGAAAAAAATAQGDASSLRLGSSETGGPLRLPEPALAAHGLVVGASGAGKTTSLLRLLEDRIARGAPVVAIDLKGSPAFAATVAEAAARAGRPFVLWSPDGPSRWNPLATGSPTELKDKLVATERFSEPHYQKIAERHLQNVLRVAAAIHPGRPSTLAETVDLCDPRRLAVALRAVPDELRGAVQRYLDELTPDALSGIRGVGTRLAILTESHTGAFLAPGPGPAVDLRAALQSDTVTVFSLNSSRYGALAAQLGTVAVQDLVSAAGERLTADPAAGAPALIAIDEFSALGGGQVLALFARAREAGISVVLATQEFADLERADRALRNQISGNTAFKLVHRQDVPSSARAVSEMAGVERVWEETRQFGSPSWMSWLSPRGTRREVERPRVHPDRIMSLRVGEAVLITKVPRMHVDVGVIDEPQRPAAATVRTSARTLARTPTPTPTPRPTPTPTRAPARVPAPVEPGTSPVEPGTSPRARGAGRDAAVERPGRTRRAPEPRRVAPRMDARER